MSFTASELKDISKNWAQERTLGELRDKMVSNNNILAAIAKEKFNLDAATIRSFEDAIDDAKDGLTELQNSAEKAKRAQVNQLRHEQRMQGYEQEIKGNYKRSVDDLRSSLDKMSRFDSSKIYDGVASGLSTLSYTFRNADGSASALSTTFTTLNKVVAVIAFGLGAFAGAMPAFQAMANTGVTFGGSLEKMQEMVGRSGLKLEEFQGIVSQFGTTIGGVGEQNFSKLVRGVQDSTRQFGLYGQTVGQQGEAVASFLDMLAKGGLAYGMSTDMQREGAVKYVRELTALTELTGKDRKEIQARQKAAAEDAAIMLRIRQLRRTDPEAAARLEANKAVIAGQFGEMGPAMARAIVGMQMGLMPSDPQMRAMMSIGELMPSMTSLSRGLTTGTTEDTMRLVQQVQTALTEGPGVDRLQLQAQLGGPYAGGAEMFAKMLPEAERAQAAAARPGGMDRILNIFTGRGGNLDRATTAFQKMSLDSARTMGDFKAAIFASTQQLALFRTALEAIAGVTGVGTGISGALYGLASSGSAGAIGALTTMAAVYAIPKLLAGGVVRTALTGLASGGGLGLTSMLGSTGIMAGVMRSVGGVFGAGTGAAGAAGGIGRFALGAGRLVGGGLLGVGGGMAGAGIAGMLGWPAWLGGALGGAAGGALVGGLPGAIIGGLLGGISAAGAAEAEPTDRQAGGQLPIDDSVRLIQMQATNTSYIAAAAELARNVMAQAAVATLTPPATPLPYNDMVAEIRGLREDVSQQTPYLNDISRYGRRTAEGVGDFA